LRQGIEFFVRRGVDVFLVDQVNRECQEFRV
jgi:hypothetical protein